MRKPLKAVLISALVYPGLGHFLFKHYIAGTIILSSFSIPLLLLVGDIVTTTNQVITQVQRGEIPLDVSAISNAILMTPGSSMQTLNIYGYIMIAAWLMGILDLYRVARKTLK